MTDETPFLRAIDRHPLDYGPVGVYADWLDERGDAGGEALRWAVRLGRLPDWQGEVAFWQTGMYRIDLFRQNCRHELPSDLCYFMNDPEVYYFEPTLIDYPSVSWAWTDLAKAWTKAQPFLRKRWLNLKPKLTLEPATITPE